MLERFLPTFRRGAEPEAAGEGEASRARDFFEMMSDIRRYPFTLMEEVSKRLAVDMSDTDEEIIVKAEMPGFEAGDIDINLRGDSLVIKGEKRQESERKEENFIRTERSYGSFSRSIALPTSVDPDKTMAKYENGLLVVTMPKREPSKSRKIEISAQSGTSVVKTKAAAMKTTEH